MPTTIGTVLPITVPQLSDQANIVTALQQLYYGTGTIPTTESGLYGTTNSIGGYIQQLFTDKANYTDKLNVFASTSSEELLSVISDATGTGALVFATSPTLVTPVLGVATATSINGTTIPTSKTLVTTADTGTVTNTMLAGSIANSKLSNSTISGVSLGNSLNSLSAGTGITLSGGYNGSASKTVSIDSTVIATSSSPSDGYVISYDATNGIVWQPVSELPGTIENATFAANATNTAITNDTSTASSVYPTWVTANTGNLPQKVTSTKLSFVPSTGILTASGFNGLTLTAQTTGFTIAGGTTSKTLTVSDTATVSGTNTGDQTTITGNAGSATKLLTARNINGVAFDGTAAITVKASTTNTLGLTSGGNLAFSSGTTWDGGTSGITVGLVTTPTGLSSINGVSLSGLTTGSFVTTVSTSTIAASTTGNAASATKAVAYVASGTSYPSTPGNRIYVGADQPTGMAIGDIWMW